MVSDEESEKENNQGFTVKIKEDEQESIEENKEYEESLEQSY